MTKIPNPELSNSQAITPANKIITPVIDFVHLLSHGLKSMVIACLVFFSCLLTYAQSNTTMSIDTVPHIGGESQWILHGHPDTFSNAANSNPPVFNWNTEFPTSAVFIPLPHYLNQDSSIHLSTHFTLNSLNIDFVPNSFYGFEIALGLFNSTEVFTESFKRGTGTDSPNLIEWDYFPDTGFGATVSPTITDSDSKFFSTFNFPIDLPIDADIEVELIYDPSQTKLESVLKIDGELKAIKPVVLPEGDGFNDFLVNSAGFISYQDFNDDGKLSASASIHAFEFSYSNPVNSTRHLNLQISDAEIVIPSDLNSLTSGAEIRLFESSGLKVWNKSQSVTVPDPVPSNIQIPLPENNDPDQALFFRAEVLGGS